MNRYPWGILLLALLAAPAGAQSLSDVDRIIWKTERNLDRASIGYHCGQFDPNLATNREIKDAADDARSRGQHVLYCSSFPKELSKVSQGTAKSGLVVFVSDEGVPQAPRWGLRGSP